MTPDQISVAAGIASIILAVVAIALGIFFFIVGRNTETRVSNSLTKIETQTDMLNRITGRQLDRLTDYVTQTQPQSSSDQVSDLLRLLMSLPQQLTATITQQQTLDAATRNEFITAYIALYFYTAQSNFWAQFYLPPVGEFDENNEFHQTVRRVVDLSAADFDNMANVLSRFDPNVLNSHNLSALLHETQTQWRNSVRSAAERFASRAQSDS